MCKFIECSLHKYISFLYLKSTIKKQCAYGNKHSGIKNTTPTTQEKNHKSVLML